MACNAPEETPGGTFNCHGTTTDWGNECHLECNSGDGYTGDIDITCNVDTSDGTDETVSWSSIPSCTRKYLSIICFCISCDIGSNGPKIGRIDMHSTIRNTIIHTKQFYAV